MVNERYLPVFDLALSVILLKERLQLNTLYVFDEVYILLVNPHASLK